MGAVNREEAACKEHRGDLRAEAVEGPQRELRGERALQEIVYPEHIARERVKHAVEERIRLERAHRRKRYCRLLRRCGAHHAYLPRGEAVAAVLVVEEPEERVRREVGVHRERLGVMEILFLSLRGSEARDGRKPRHPRDVDDAVQDLAEHVAAEEHRIAFREEDEAHSLLQVEEREEELRERLIDVLEVRVAVVHVERIVRMLDDYGKAVKLRGYLLECRGRRVCAELYALRDGKVAHEAEKIPSEIIRVARDELEVNREDRAFPPLRLEALYRKSAEVLIHAEEVLLKHVAENGAAESPGP